MLEKELATTGTASYLVDKGDVACSNDCLTSAGNMARNSTFEVVILGALLFPEREKMTLKTKYIFMKNMTS